MAKVGEASLAIITELLDHKVNDKIEIVLSDDSDDANGSATVMPYPIVRAFVTAPDDLSFLAEHQYWVYELIGHELTHIVHLDTTGNVARILNLILGRTWMPNQYQSRWFIEGLAVEMETRISLGGRARSRFDDMIFRSEAIEGNPLRFDQALFGPYRWPQGQSWYMHGGRFFSYVAVTYGHDKLREISHRYGSTLIPYTMNRAFQAVIGKSYDEVWADFQKALYADYAVQLARVQETPLVMGKAITTRGQHNYNPRYAPDGRLFYFAESFSAIPALRAFDPRTGEDRELHKISYQGQMSQPRADGHLVYSMTEYWRTYYTYQDLFDYDWQHDKKTRLTSGARARDPLVSPDNAYVYFVQNLGVRTRLMRAPLLGNRSERSLGAFEVVWDPGGRLQMHTPRMSPDGALLALSVFRPPGQRDIAVLNLQACERDGNVVPREAGKACAVAVSWITDDQALDGGPTFSPDGETLFFHSSRSDIYNIYAYRFDDRTLKRVSNVMTGAFSPEISPDGKRMAYLQYSTRGYDVHELELDARAFVEVPDRPRRDPAYVQAGSLPTTALGEPTRLQSHAYGTWKTLLPRQWLPVVTNDAYGTVLGIAVAGQDPLGRHSWGASFGGGLVSRDLNYSLIYENRQLYPTISLGTSRNIQAAPTPATISGQSIFVAERAHRADINVRVPLARALWQLQFELSYFFEHRERLTTFNFRPDGPKPILPPTGNFAGLGGSITFSRTRRSAGAVSPEYGQRITVSGTVRDPWLGSDYRQAQLAFSVAHYQLMPWLQNHALMLRVGGGGGYNELATRALTSLGGLVLRDPLRDLIFGTAPPDSGVRGFPVGAFAGDFYYTGTAEYRAPLWRIDRGWSTLPVYIRTLAAAAFVDVANAGSLNTVFRAIGVGVGAELRLDLDYGFLFGTSLRFGYARGLTQNGIHNVYFMLSNGF